AARHALVRPHTELRGQYDVVAPSFENLAQEPLAAAAAVDVRRVQEGDLRLECGLDDLPRLLEVEPAAEVVAPEADAGDADAARAEFLQAHAAFSQSDARLDRHHQLSARSGLSPAD